MFALESRKVTELNGIVPQSFEFQKVKDRRRNHFNSTQIRKSSTFYKSKTKIADSVTSVVTRHSKFQIIKTNDSDVNRETNKTILDEKKTKDYTKERRVDIN